MSKFCANCGTQNDDNSRFCENCGTVLGEINQDAAKYAAPMAEDVHNSHCDCGESHDILGGTAAAGAAFGAVASGMQPNENQGYAPQGDFIPQDNYPNSGYSPQEDFGNQNFAPQGDFNNVGSVPNNNFGNSEYAPQNNFNNQGQNDFNNGGFAPQNSFNNQMQNDFGNGGFPPQGGFNGGYASYGEPLKKKSKLPIFIAVGVLAIALICALLWFFLGKGKDKPVNNNNDNGVITTQQTDKDKDKSDDAVAEPSDNNDVVSVIEPGEIGTHLLNKYDGFVAKGWPQGENPSIDDIVAYLTKSAVDAWGLIDYTDEGRYFFEVFLDDTYEYPEMSFYISPVDDGTFVVSDYYEDCWIGDKYFDKELYELISDTWDCQVFEDGEILITFLSDGGEDMTINLKVAGSSWDSGVDVVPPRFR